MSPGAVGSSSERGVVYDTDQQGKASEGSESDDPNGDSNRHKKRQRARDHEDAVVASEIPARTCSPFG